MNGLISGQEIPYSWMTWWVGDVIGVVVMLPLIFVSRALERNPEIQALSWNPIVMHEQRPVFEKEARGQGLSGFMITERGDDGELLPAASRPRHVVVRFIVPYEGNESALGYDVYSEVTRRIALDAKELLSLRPTLPVILCTGYSESIDENVSKGLGVAEFLKKPISSDQLMRSISTLLSSER